MFNSIKRLFSPIDVNAKNRQEFLNAYLSLLNLIEDLPISSEQSIQLVKAVDTLLLKSDAERSQRR
jgi:hypothetical protein